MRPIIIIGAGMAGYTAARELRKRIKDDLDAGRFTSSSGARRPTKVVAEGKRAGKTSHGRSKSAPTS